MGILDVEIVKGYIRLTEDAVAKGWHERNGGNFSYRMKPEYSRGDPTLFPYPR